MASSLVSAGVVTNIIDRSVYVSNQSATVPLVFIATADEKTQADGVTPALGTYENNVIRTVTSVDQLLQLYGTPRYITDSAGNPFHGDARNEYGLDALVKMLQISNLAYVIRANVNLNDDITFLKGLWNRKLQDAANFLNELTQEYISSYNIANNLFPTDVGYKETITKDEMTQLSNQALEDVFNSYSFSSDLFQNAFMNDHTVAHAGYLDVVFDTSGGQLQLSDITGLDPVKNYAALVEIVAASGTQLVNFTYLGSDVTTFGDLVDAMNVDLGADGHAELLGGKLRISSTLDGVTSSVTLINQGASSTIPLFSSLNTYSHIGDPIPGVGVQVLDTYNDDYTIVTGSYDGYASMIDAWTGTTVVNEFTPDEAEGLLLASQSTYVATKEFSVYSSLGSNDAARRVAIVKQLNAAIANPLTGATGENIQYDLLATPGYSECTSAMVQLSQAVHSEVFVIGDSPLDKPATGPNGITVWATTPDRVNNFLNAYWYGHGLSTNIDGAEILTTSAAIALRTIAYSDSVSEKWYAPAGTTRGTCPQLTNVGYVSGTLGGPTTFVTDYLNQGTRDALYQFPININPISYIPGRGIIVMGQKTSSPITSSLDRINVARMTLHIRRQLRQALFAFLFEPNDKKTWDNVKYVTDNFLNGLKQRRGLYDFATVCSEVNNTPQTIDNNELHIACYIAPTKSIEFIYLDITLVNTGTDLSAFQG